ncbi:MAG: T9SS type A sorting domain-containing protein [Bacteroidota bacterium]
MNFTLRKWILPLLLTGFGISAQAQSTFTKKVATGTDDAEEAVTGSVGYTIGDMDLTSSDLEIMSDSTTATSYRKQNIGIRFTGVTIPKNAVITGAFIQFATKGDKNATFGNATIKGELVANSATYSATAKISTRPTTAAAVTWAGSTSSTWGLSAAGTRGTNQKTPDLKAIIQEIVNQSDWNSGNALSVILSGANGVRNTFSFNGAGSNTSYIPELTITYTEPDPIPSAKLLFPANGEKCLGSAAGTVQLKLSLTDVNASDVLTVKFYGRNKEGAFQLLSTQTSSTGNTLTYNWTALPDSKDFEWYANVSDGSYDSTTTTFAFSTITTPNVNLGSDFNLDCGEQRTLDAGNAGSGYLWSTGATSQTISVATEGKYWVRATRSGVCASSDTIIIGRDPIVSITNIESEYRENSAPVALIGFPSGGIFSGDGITGNVLDPASLETGGPYAVKYTYTNGSGCTTVVNASFTVLTINAPLVRTNAVWKYLDNGSNQGTAWRAENFDDSNWKSGPAELGFGEGDEATVLSFGPDASNKYITAYFRKSFTISDLSQYTSIQFNYKRDDGMVLYVNGTELFRDGFGASVNVLYNTLSSDISDDGQALLTKSFTIPASLLKNGKNVITAEVHQNAVTSSDLTFSCEVIGKIPGAAAIVRGPYLQTGTSESIIIHWQTDEPTNSKVTYGPTANSHPHSVTDTAQTTEHIVKLTGLTPYTKYYYTIGSTTVKIQGDSANYFMTSPTPGAEGKYTFWVTGDCGTSSTNQKNVRDRYNTYIGNGVTNGWLLLGDNAYNSGTESEFTSNFFNIYQNDIMKHAPLWPALGNHDYANNFANQDSHNVPYFGIFDLPKNAEAGGVPSKSEAFYSYDYGNVHFISIDSYGREEGTRLYDTLGPQVQWIKADLASNTKKWVVAYWHHAPFTKGSHNSDTEDELKRIRTNFVRILERHGVDLILTGHSHSYERSKLQKGHYDVETTFNANTHNISQSSGKYDGSANSCTYLKDSLHTDGTVYVVAGSSGQLSGTTSGYPHNMMYYSDVTTSGSLVLEFDGSRMDAKFVCADGQIRDNFTIIKDGATVKDYTVDLGDTANMELTAAWKGAYKWKHSSETTKTVNVSASSDTSFIVTDQYQCISDTFRVKVINPSLKVTVTGAVCPSSTSNLSFTAAGKFAPQNRFTLELSDANGNFSNPTILAVDSTGSGTFAAAIPALAAGSGYQLRIRSSVPAYTDNVNLSALTIFTPPTVNFAPLSSVCLGSPAFTLTGGTPAGGTYAGTSVTSGKFDPKTSGSGLFVLSYSYTDANGCNATDTSAIQVNQLPGVTLGAINPACSNGGLVSLTTGTPEGGSYSGTGVTGNQLDPASGSVGSRKILYTYTDANGCQGTASTTIVINSVPSVSLADQPAICINSGEVKLYGGLPSGGSYSGTGVSNGKFDPSAGTGSYTVTYSYTRLTTGCTGTASKKISVISKPEIAFALQTAICTNEAALTLSATPAGGSFSGPGVSNGTFNPATAGVGSKTIVYTYTNGQCSNSAEKSITVNALPLVTLADFPEVCENAPGFALSGGLPDYGTYSINGSTVTSFNPSEQGSGNKTIRYSYTNANGCSTFAEKNLTVKAVTAVTAPAAQSVCIDATEFMLTGQSPIGGQFSGNGISGLNFNPSVAGTGVHPIAYSFTNDKGCSTSATFNIEVKALSSVSITAPSGNSACTGGSVVLETTSTTGIQWYKDGQLISGATAPQYTATLAGNYSLTAGGNGCTGTSPEIQVIFNSLPAPSITYPLNPVFCSGASVALQTQNFDSYNWKLNGNSTSSQASVNATETGTYSVTVTDQNGCQGTSIGVNISSSSPVVISSDKNPTICPNESITLSCSNAVSYQWFRNNTPLNGATAATYTTTEAGVYHVTATDQNGCSATSATLEVKRHISLPGTQVRIDGTAEICEGATTKLVTTGAFVSYQWYRNGNKIPGAVFRTYVNSKPGVFTAFVEDQNGCKDFSDPATISVNLLPVADIQSSTFRTVCLPKLLTIGTPQVAATSYSWSRNNEAVAEATNSYIRIDKTGLYQLTATTEKGCTATSRKVLVNASTVPAQPVVVLIQPNVLECNYTERLQWFKNNEKINGATGRQLELSGPGVYTVSYTSAAGCSSVSDNYSQNLSGISSIESEAISVYPNPVKDILSVSCQETAAYQLFDLGGKTVANGTIHPGTTHLDLSELAKGVYQLKISSGATNTVRRIIKD